MAIKAKIDILYVYVAIEKKKKQIKDIQNTYMYVF
jgi:hypothetical protein